MINPVGGTEMKTFKLKSLRILQGGENEIKKHAIELVDGLIINREDEQGQWLIEAYLHQQQKPFLKAIQQADEEIMIEVKITTKSNDPVTFITKMIGLNDIGDDMNVLFLGKMVDKQKSIIEGILSELIAEGYQGEELLERFKKRI